MTALPDLAARGTASRPQGSAAPARPGRLPAPVRFAGAAASSATVGGLVAVMLALLWYIGSRAAWSPDTVTWLALAATGLAALLVLLTPGVPLAGFVGVYGLYLAVSHLGFAGSLLFAPGDAVAGLYPWELEWLYLPQRPVAVALAGLGIGALGLGATLFWRLSPRSPRRDAPDDGGWPGFYWLGMAMLAFSACYMLIAVATGALPVFEGYMEYRSAIRDVPFYAQMLFALATGLTFTFAVGTGRQRTWALLLFAVPALLLGITGNRGSMLWPLTGAMAVWSTRGFRPRLGVVLGGAFLFFIYIPVSGQLRSEGLARFDLERLSVNWTSPFVTNGWTLRPLVFTVQWIDEGEELARGETYALPVRRILGALTPFVERPEYSSSPHSWEALHARLPTQGYSVVAEAYYNFGTAGVLIVLSVIGAFLAFFGDRASTGPSLAAAGAAMVVLVNHVRNYSVFVPGQLVWVLMVWLAGLALTLAMSMLSKRIGPAARPAPGSPQVQAPPAAPFTRSGAWR